MSSLTWEFSTTTGVGSFEITVHVSYETDEDGIYAENIDKVTHGNFDLTGIFCEEQLADLEMETSMKLRDHYEQQKYLDFGLL